MRLPTTENALQRFLTVVLVTVVSAYVLAGVADALTAGSVPQLLFVAVATAVSLLVAYLLAYRLGRDAHPGRERERP